MSRSVRRSGFDAVVIELLGILALAWLLLPPPGPQYRNAHWRVPHMRIPESVSRVESSNESARKEPDAKKRYQYTARKLDHYGRLTMRILSDQMKWLLAP